MLLVTKAFKKSPKKSHLRVLIELEILRRFLQRLQCCLDFILYCPRVIHGLLEEDLDWCIQFCEIVLNNREMEIVLMEVFGFDKTCLAINQHNCSYSSHDNPQETIEKQYS